VSSDSAASHQAFAAKHRLPFPIISDSDRALRKRFGVPSPLGFLPGRVTFVIDKAGVVRLAFNALLVSDDHVKKALAAVAAVPGALLFALAWALQRLGGTAPSRRNAAAVPMSSASSLTRAAAPSLIISGSAVRGDSVTTARRPSS